MNNDIDDGKGDDDDDDGGDRPTWPTMRVAVSRTQPTPTPSTSP